MEKSTALGVSSSASPELILSGRDAVALPEQPTPDDHTMQVMEVVQRVFKFSPREHQLTTLLSLFHYRRDTILYAPTSAGKSLIAQVYPILHPGWVLCIIPITRLAQEQVKDISKLSGLNAVLLNGENNNPLQRAQIQQGIAAESTGHITHGEQTPFQH
jgi:superfamily II DNA helicase RecQ